MTAARARKIALLLAGVLLIAAVIWATARSVWFAERVRERAIASLQQLTGGRAEVRSAKVHWLDKSVDLGGVVLHGTEPPNRPPLFSADRIRVQVPLSFLWRPGADLGAVEVARPRIFLEGGALPLPANLRNVSHLHLSRLRVQDGIVKLRTGWAIPLSIDAAGVQLTLSAHSPRRGYAIVCSADSFRLSTSNTRFNATLKAAAELDANQLRLSRISLQEGRSHLIAAGMFDPGLHGALNFQVHLDAATFEQPRASSGTLDAVGRFELAGNPDAWTVTGSAEGQDLRFRGLPQSLAIRATYTATPQSLRLPVLHAASPMGKFDGSADVARWTRLSASGSVRDVDIQRVARHWSKAAAWTGSAAGTVRMQANLASFPLDSEVDVNVHLTPGHLGVPLQGSIVASYLGRSDSVRFDQLALASPGMELTCSGTTRGALTLHVQAANAPDLEPLLVAILGRDMHPFAGTVRDNLRNTRMQFDGALQKAVLSGTVVLNGLSTGSVHWDQVRASLVASSSSLKVTSALLTALDVQASLAGSATLDNWMFDASTAVFRTVGKVQAADPGRLIPFLRGSVVTGSSGMSAAFRLAGSAQQPSGEASFRLDRLQILGQPLTRATGKLSIATGRLILSSVQAHSGGAVLTFFGSYIHSPKTLREGQLAVRLDTAGFPMTLAGSLPAAGSITIHSETIFEIQDAAVRLQSVSGDVSSPRLLIAGEPYTNVSISAKTEQDRIVGQVAAAFEGEPIQAGLQIDSTRPFVMRASIHSHNVALQTIARAAKVDASGLTGRIAGDAVIAGPLLRPSLWTAHVNLSELTLHREVAGTAIDLHNLRPAVLDVRAGTAHLDEIVLASQEGQLSAAGDIELTTPHALHLTLAGSLGLQAFELFDPNVLSAGVAAINANLSGTLDHPAVTGTARIRNGSLFLKDLQTGLTAVDAQVQFSRNRALITSLAGESGGGRIRIDGLIDYAAGRSVTYNLKAEAHGVRYRYANGIGVSGDSVLRLTGTTANGVVSGDVSVARVVVSPEVDLGAVLASGAVAREIGLPGQSLLPDLQLDLRIQSLPNLQVSTAVARDVAASIDLRVRGTPAHPRVSGSISANQGDLRIFGAKYSINRCEITFENASRIDPVVDLDLETQSRGVSVDITVAGRLDKLSMNYRSDPPLQPKDIIALLTVGKPPTFAPTDTIQHGTTDISALQAGANTVLGQAATPGSNRLSKLFGITNIKIDPFVEGMTNTPQSRLTVEQQISKNVTVTYVTNLAQTSEQIFRFEWALNPQYSVVAVRDDNGEFGIDVQFKKRFH